MLSFVCKGNESFLNEIIGWRTHHAVCAGMGAIGS